MVQILKTNVEIKNRMLMQKGKRKGQKIQISGKTNIELAN